MHNLNKNNNNYNKLIGKNKDLFIIHLSRKIIYNALKYVIQIIKMRIRFFFEDFSKIEMYTILDILIFCLF